MIRRYFVGLLGLLAASFLFSNPANALYITGGVGDTTRGVGVTGIGDQCLEIGGTASTAPVAPVHSWDCNLNLNQMWIVTNGEIQKSNNGRFTCLEVAGGARTSGSKVQLNNCSGATSQQWVINQKGEIVGVGSDLCLDWGLGYYQNNIQLTIEPCTGTPEQQFWFR